MRRRYGDRDRRGHERHHRDRSRGSGAEDVVANPVTNRIYAASFQSQTVAVIDGNDNTLIATVSVADNPFSIAVNPVTNRVYSRGAQSVSVLDGVTNTVIATIPVDGGPWGLAVNASTNRVYVSDAAAGAVDVIDGGTNIVIASIPLGAQPWGMDVNPAANRLYVAAGSDVKVVDTTTLSVIAAVPVEGEALAVASNPATNRLYVRTEQGGVAVVDALTNAVVRTFAVSDGSATNADVGVNPATNAVYVPMAGQNVVWVTQDPAPFGGRDFGITVVPGGVRLTWTPGTEETGYSIVRWAADSDTVETLEGLPQGTTSFVDQEPLTESAYHYVLLPLDDGGSPLWMSEVLGVQPNTQSTQHAPPDFTLRHAAHAHHMGQVGFGVAMSWQAPGDQAGYVLAAMFPDGNQEIPLGAQATSAIQVISEPSCFMVFAGVGEEVGYTHSLCAIPLTWAMNNSLSSLKNRSFAPNRSGRRPQKHLMESKRLRRSKKV